MEVLKFTLSGKTAFFKKPEVNTYLYFTYGHIHKIALLGILGAILGYGGYNQQKRSEEEVYPEFYEKLKDIKIGIVPKNDKGYIPKKVQSFNNSVGYASKEKGGNLIVNEQWLENPVWEIYVLIDGEREQELANRVIQRRFHYIPYLGKNDHIANLTGMKIISDIKGIQTPGQVDSLIIKDFFEFEIEEDDLEAEPVYKYQEMLPVRLEEKTNKYDLETFIYTNAFLRPKEQSLLYQCDEEKVFFF